MFLGHRKHVNIIIIARDVFVNKKKIHLNKVTLNFSVDWKMNWRWVSIKFCSVLWLGAFRSHMPVKPLIICAVVVDHVVISDPLEFPLLVPTQLLIDRGGPPISFVRIGTLVDAKWSIPLASPCIKLTQTSLERCT